LPAVPRRTPPSHPALRLRRAHLRRDPPTGQGHRQAPGETSCLTLVWAVLDRASRGWRGLTMTADRLRLLPDPRRSLPEPPPPPPGPPPGPHRRACRRSQTASTVA